MAARRSPEEQLAYLTDGIDTVLPEGELIARLREDRPLRVKLGVDPTAPDVTLGWAVVFRLLRRFQEMGHLAVLIVGDFTAQVGDPSLRSETRNRLSSAEVEGYAANLLGTIQGLLLPERLEIRRNSEWLGALTMTDVLELTSKFTVARIMDRDDFTKRWHDQRPISLIEFMYPLLQAMDSVAVKADIEIGGSDQLFNLLVGRDLQLRSGQEPQLVMTVPLLVGTDGEKKMSQSIGNYISVRDEPAEMFGKTMSIPDTVMGEWFSLAAGALAPEVDEIRRGLDGGRLHPGETKRELARRIVAIYHDEEAARSAEEEFDLVFREGESPGELDEYDLTGADDTLVAVLTQAKLASSRSEARRLIRQGAVSIDGERVTDETLETTAISDGVVRVGKRRFLHLVRSGD